MRLDLYLSKYHNLSRNRAQSLIKDGFIKVDGKSIQKPSFDVEEPEIEIDKEKIYVSRAGDKLNRFLESKNIDFSKFSALDIGASTGGFTEVLLENGVKEVFALDVGTLQLSQQLREDKRVISIENMDIRKFQTRDKFNLITCDVSFISLHQIIRDIDRLSNGRIIILFKPQFEVGRDIKRDKSGVVKDEKAIEESFKRFLQETEKLKWRLVTSEDSKLKGKEGNREIFLMFSKS